MRPDPTTGAAGSEGPAAVLPAPALPAAVLWDMDGTLVDSEPYWIAAEHELVARYGGQWSDSSRGPGRAGRRRARDGDPVASGCC